MVIRKLLRMKKIISASRRSDLVAFFPDWLASAVKEEHAFVYGPSGQTYRVDLSPKSVHTFILWSKNFAHLIEDCFSLRSLLKKYDQLYLHFTITGLGGTPIEKGVPRPGEAVAQLDDLVKIAEHPQRISVRFDPILYWREQGEEKTNLFFFEELAPVLQQKGIRRVRLSFAQWYARAKRRAIRQHFDYIDPPQDKKIEDAGYLVELARRYGLNLFACSQKFLTEDTGIDPSACIDGKLLQDLHPLQEPASMKKDRSQRSECGCTESVDIGSYTQSCPHSCLYCYANPRE